MFELNQRRLDVAGVPQASAESLNRKAKRPIEEAVTDNVGAES